MKVIQMPVKVIDTHVHGRGMKEYKKTTVKQVLLEASLSGIDISFFMPNTIPRIDNTQTLSFYAYHQNLSAEEAKIKDQQYIFFEFNGKNLHECKNAWWKKNVIGFKVHPDAWDNYWTVFELMRFARKHDLVVDFHCNSLPLRESYGDIEETEAYQIKEVVTLAKLVPGVKITICHVTCMKSTEIILRAQDQGIQVAIEITPHHLWFDYTSWRKFGKPQWFYCQNILRSIANENHLRWLIAQNNPLIFIGSDSACHTQKEKLELNLPGIPSNQEMLAVLATLTENGLPEERIPYLSSFNAAKHYGIDVPQETVPWEFEERIDDIEYNNNVVFNPWNGEKLMFPKRRS